MNSLTPARFTEFFQAVNGFGPFPWQRRLAERVCEPGRSWPRAIALPTAAGKTACIDIAVYSLAYQANLPPSERTAPRRILFVVDRRVVVDQAYEHAKQLGTVLKKAKSGIPGEVADALRKLAGDPEGRPLDVYPLRGGMYREAAWARSPLQPTVIASTVDQIGSRLLFRGYGVSDSMKPIHAGLVSNDALILLDEAHCSRPFDQTVRAIERYRSWGEGAPAPFQFVSITATPTDAMPADQIERDNEEDHADPVLGPRIRASKPANLVIASKATGRKWQPELVKELAKQARGLMGQSLGVDAKGVEHSVKAVGVIVNRVATARELAAALKVNDIDPILLTGRMRPVDRDAVVRDRLQPLFSGKGGELLNPTFVVATQCLEVGADLDFHALVSECASLDALRQRFGRLNRVAARPSGKAAIVIRGDQTDDTSEDPVYGASIAETWKWLRGDGPREEFDFGVAAVRAATENVHPSRLNAPMTDAPVLFPAHLDCWVQTSPIPAPDPDPALFLHGPRSGMPDVQVVLRGDLGDDPKKWAEVVSLCPPSSSEALPVRMDVFRRWLAGTDARDESGDVEGEVQTGELEETESVARQVLRWLGPNNERTEIVSKAGAVRPGETFVVRTTESGLEGLGDFPTLPPTDCGDEAFRRSRDKAIVRLQGLSLDDEDQGFEEELTKAISDRLPDDAPEPLRRAFTSLLDPDNRSWVRYPEPHVGFVVTGDKRLRQFDPTYLEDTEPGESPKGRSKGRPVTLEDHSRGVAKYASKFASGCGLPADLYERAGYWHDLGKLDSRFQAMLKGRSPRTAGGTALAKSGSFGSGDRSIHCYPAGGRHELLSAAMVAQKTDDDLLLHLIATHHGTARPFADPVAENDAAESPFRRSLFGAEFHLDSAAQNIAAWNGILPERFWRVVRQFGWWGAAYREAVFRLADHTQSRDEQEPGWIPSPTEGSPNPIRQAASSGLPSVPIVLSGLDGSNPLAFLAALGTLRLLSEASRSPSRPDWLQGTVRLSWGSPESPVVAVLHLASDVGHDELVSFLADHSLRDLNNHPANCALALMGSAGEGVIDRLRSHAERTEPQRRLEVDWVAAMFAPSAPDAASQLLMVRRDYLTGNVESILQRTSQDHLRRSLFESWDYADALDNQSLHWEPSEDRRHAYQWHQPNGDPTRKTRGGMLGANRLAIEAWPFFFSVAMGDRLSTRGFTGNRASDTYWTWPLWSAPLSLDAVASLLAHPELKETEPDAAILQGFGIVHAFRSWRILVGKTPNLTPAVAV
jgi:CRISPR-associated endonuclease/helicase Cas3